MSKILIVEDERKLSRYLELELTHEGYTTCAAYDGRAALKVFEEQKCDLILLDLMLPELSGIEVCRRIRQKSTVPIIMLTAKDDTSDKVMGLDMGADDYMTKPFAIEELLARIRVALKRRSPAAAPAPQNNDHILIEGLLQLDKVWGYSYTGDTNVVDVYIRYLRSKIDDAFHIKTIHTVRGVGYLLRMDS